MKIQIKNLGQIESAVLNDNNLVVMVGDNGTGKTLLLESMALISNRVNSAIRRIYSDIVNDFNESFKLDDWKNVEKSIREKMEQGQNNKSELTEVRPSFNLDVFVSDEKNINETIKGKIGSELLLVKEELSKRILFSHEEETNLSVDLIDIPEIKSGKLNIELNFDFYDDDLILIINKSLNMNGHLEYIDIKNYIDKERIQEIENYSNKSLYKKFLNFESFFASIKEKITLLFLNEIMGAYFQDNALLFLPSERNLYMQNAMAKVIDFEEFSTGLRYSEELFIKSYLDFTTLIKSFINNENFKKRNRPLIDGDTSDLFDGELTFNKDGEVESIEKNGVKIQRLLFSTKINRLIPYLIIGQPIRSYSKIIIEEPEAHLSLKSMSALIKYFAKLLNDDKKLVITTHSDVFFTRLNNLFLTMPDLPVTVYELENDGEKSKLNEVNRTENGYEIKLFTEELSELFDETINIQDGD
ncbi:AAA family ATPase [Lysinibacillus xylanilyticus]|uniref:AAA family ATPase n=1 Tax=Lysinibacillus xylanilyticus TaxID=582475 RepID=UPI003D044535